MNKILRMTALGLVLIASSLSAKGQISKYVNSAYNLVKYSNDAGQVGEAKDDIDKAYKMEGAQENAKMWLVRSMVYSRIFDKRTDSFLKAVSADAGYITGYSMMKFWQSATIKKLDKEDAIEETPSAFNACYNESFTAMGNEQYEKAIEYYQICIFLFDRMDTSKSNELNIKYGVNKSSMQERIALAAYQIKDPAKRLGYLQQLSDGGNNSPLVVEKLSNTYLETKDTARAESVIRNAMAKNPGNKVLFQILINYFVAINRIDRLMEDLNKQIEVSPESSWYFSRGVLYEQSKEYDKAIADYRKAIELDELNYDANNNLGRLLLMHIGNKLRDKKLAAPNAAAKKQAEQELQDLYKEAYKMLEVAAENTKGYTADELIGIHKSLKNLALEMGNQSEADRHESMIKALEASKKQN